MKFKHKIQLQFADNQTRLTHSVQELYPMKGKGSGIILKFPSDCVTDEEAQHVYLQVLHIIKRQMQTFHFTFFISMELCCHWYKK